MLYAIVAVIVLILDQAMKYWTTLHLELNAGVKELIPGLIHLRNYHNTGSAFSMFGDWAGARWMFLIVTVLFAVLVILALARKLITGKFGRWMALGILAGALGNGIDRMLYGYVVDMFQFGFWKSFPIFNVADIFITVCGVLFCVYILLHKDPLSAPDKQGMRKGPGGSITTKPAPKRVEKPAKPEKAEKAEKPAASAPRRLAKKDESAPRKITMPKLPTLPKREEKPAPKRVEKPAAERRPFFEKEEEAPVAAPKSTRARRTMKQGEPSPLEQIQRPVVTRESFIEMTKRKPGDDPFAEWMQPKAEPAVEPEMPAVAAEPVETVHEEVPVREVQPEMPVFEAQAEPVAERESAVEPESVKASEPVIEPVKAEVKEDVEFSLEDILNEFRDI